MGDLNQKLLPFYIWAAGGILLCLLALWRIYAFRKKHKFSLSLKDSAVLFKYNNLLKLLLFAVIGYMFCAIPVIGLISSGTFWYFFSGILFIWLGVLFFHSR